MQHPGGAFSNKATDAPRKKSESWEPSASSARSLSGNAPRPAPSLGSSLMRDSSVNSAGDLGGSQVSSWGCPPLHVVFF
jgi:hypothetical protein